MKKILQLQIFQFTRSLIVALLLVVGLSFAYAWTGPTATAPGNNTDEPINVSATTQTKAGGLWLNALGVTRNAIIGKVQLDDTVVEGTACGVLNPDGTISRNAIGETLACVSGIWTKVGGGGGRYVGEVFSFAGATCPSGSLLANGATFSAATYSDLETILGGTTLPDLRGEFIRGLDNGRGVDGGRVLGSTQADMFKSHTHDQAPNTEIAFGPTMREVNGSGDAGITVGGTTQATGGSETRPRNVAFNTCVVATGIVGGGDTTPPSQPTNLSASAVSSSQIDISWTPSTDNVGVTGYKIFRGGTQIAISPTASYSNTGLSGATTYTYTVLAYDAAGNDSPQSTSASATTQAVAGSWSARQVGVGPGCNGTLSGWSWPACRAGIDGNNSSDPSRLGPDGNPVQNCYYVSGASSQQYVWDCI